MEPDTDPVDRAEPFDSAYEQLEPTHVEVEGVEEAGGRRARDAVQLDGDPSSLELGDERAQELVAAARGRGCEFVKQGEVCASAPSIAGPIDLGRELTSHHPGRPARADQSSVHRHARTVIGPQADSRSSRIVSV